MSLALGGCAMYAAPPTKLRNPEVVRGPKTDKPPPAPPVPVYIEECDTPRPATEPQRQTKVAAQRLDDGDARLSAAMKAPPDSPQRAEALKQSLELYRDAVAKDHFHPEATLMLARTYDMFHRKKCALDMLERIGAMRRGKFKGADRVGLLVDNNADTWFATYATKARDAVTP